MLDLIEGWLLIFILVNTFVILPAMTIYYLSTLGKRGD